MDIYILEYCIIYKKVYSYLIGKIGYIKWKVWDILCKISK